MGGAIPHKGAVPPSKTVPPIQKDFSPPHGQLGSPPDKIFLLNYLKVFLEIRPYLKVLVTNLPHCVVD